MEQPADPSQKIQELQSLEQNFQMLLHQKQTVQIQLNEISNASKEVSASSGDIYKTLSGVMIKADKETVLKELEEKKKETESKLSGTDEQEKMINEKIQALRQELTKGLAEAKK